MAVDATFIEKVRQKQHNEVIALLTQLVNKISALEPEVTVDVDLSSLKAAIDTIDVTNPKLETLPAELDKIGKSIVAKIEEINKQRKPKRLEVERDPVGRIKSVNVIY